MTKTLTIRMSFSLRARLTSDRCPSWSAPIVGTSPIVFPLCRAELTRDMRLLTVRIISILEVILHSGAKLRKIKLRIAKMLVKNGFVAEIEYFCGCKSKKARIEWNTEL